MKITAMYFHGSPRGNFCGYCDVVFDRTLKINKIRIVRNPDNKLIVCMPNRKNITGEWEDVVHPINSELRNTITELIIEVYSWKVKTQK